MWKFPSIQFHTYRIDNHVVGIIILVLSCKQKENFVYVLGTLIFILTHQTIELTVTRTKQNELLIM